MSLDPDTDVETWLRWPQSIRLSRDSDGGRVLIDNRIPEAAT